MMRKVIYGWLIIWVCLGLGLFEVSRAVVVWVRGWGLFGCARSSISASRSYVVNGGLVLDSGRRSGLD